MRARLTACCDTPPPPLRGCGRKALCAGPTPMRWAVSGCYCCLFRLLPQRLNAQQTPQEAPHGPETGRAGRRAAAGFWRPFRALKRAAVPVAGSPKAFQKGGGSQPLPVHPLSWLNGEVPCRAGHGPKPAGTGTAAAHAEPAGMSSTRECLQEASGSRTRA